MTAERQRGSLFLEAPTLTKTLTPFVGASTFDWSLDVKGGQKNETSGPRGFSLSPTSKSREGRMHSPCKAYFSFFCFLNRFTFFFLLNFLFCIRIQLTSNVVIVSGEQPRESAIHIHVSILPPFAQSIPKNRPPNAKNWLIGQDPGAGKYWRQEEKGTTKDEMVGWHHRLDGHECEQALGVGDGQGSLGSCSPWGQKESDTTERLNWLTDT